MHRVTIRAPAGYGERVRAALESLPGTVTARAAALGTSRVSAHRWIAGDGGPADPGPLAELAGVPEALLVYGPTHQLRVELARAALRRVEGEA